MAKMSLACVFNYVNEHTNRLCNYDLKSAELRGLPRLMLS